MTAAPLRPVARIVRTSARLALWASVTITAAAAFLLDRWAHPLPTGYEEAIESDQARFAGVDFAAMPEVRMLREYVAIDSSQPDPDELAAAEFLAGHLRAMGLEPHVERLGEKNANVWALLEGRRPEALVLHGHLDVEPLFDPALWEHAPLGGEIEGPWIYGRGMYDMKSLTVAQLFALGDLAARARAGEPPERSVLFLATSSEEIGSDLGTRWILAEHPELRRRMWAVLTEGGVIEATGPTRIKYWGIEFAQKRFAALTLCARERARLDGIHAALLASSQGDPRHPLAPDVDRFLDAYAPTRSAEFLRRRLSGGSALALDAPRFAQLTPFLKALYRDEVYPFRIAAAADGSSELKVLLHLLPGSELADVAPRLLPEELTWGVTRSAWEQPVTETASPLDHPLYRELESVTRELYPDVPVGPYFLPWSATDARYFRAAGIPAYGYSPFPVVVTDTMNIGRPEERMQLPAFVEGVRLYQQVVSHIAADEFSAGD